MSNEPEMVFGEQRLNSYTGSHLEEYRQGYAEKGRFGRVRDLSWSAAQNEAYQQGVSDRCTDDTNNALK